MPILTVMLLAAVAAPVDGGARTPYDLELAPHLVATGAMAGVGLLFKLAVSDTLPGGLACTPAPGSARCDPDDLNALDRLVVGDKSDAWLLATDISVGVMAVGATAALAADSLTAGSAEPWRDLVVDVVVVAEATALATTLTQLGKFAFRRPRPTAYADVGGIQTVEHQLSFPSGHSTTAAALGAAWATTFWLRHPDSPWRWAAVGGAVALTAFTAGGRAIGGFHFPTDVIAGSLVGGATGFVLPYLLRRRELPLVVGFTGRGASLALAF